MIWVWLIAAGLLILLVHALVEGVALAWGERAFTRDECGGLHLAERVSQIIWILMGVGVVLGVSYSLWLTLGR